MVSTGGNYKLAAERLGQENFLFTLRGSSALWLYLKALNPGDLRIIIPANVCEIVVGTILDLGMTPLYADVDPLTGNCRVEDLEQAFQEGTKLLLAVHNYGQPLPMPEVMEWANEKGIRVIEDVCNALGATIGGIPAGCFGDAAIYSFGYGKIIDAGIGGALAAKDFTVIDRCRALQNNLPVYSSQTAQLYEGCQKCLRFIRQYRSLQQPAVYNALYRILQPAVLHAPTEGLSSTVLGKIAGLDENIAIRGERAYKYRNELNHPLVIHPPHFTESVCWRYSIHVPGSVRDDLIEHLRGRGLPVSKWYPAVDRLFHDVEGETKNRGVDMFEQTVVNMWVDISVSEEIVDMTIEEILQFMNGRKKGNW